MGWWLALLAGLAAGAERHDAPPVGTGLVAARGRGLSKEEVASSLLQLGKSLAEKEKSKFDLAAEGYEYKLPKDGDKSAVSLEKSTAANTQALEQGRLDLEAALAANLPTGLEDMLVKPFVQDILAKWDAASLPALDGTWEAAISSFTQKPNPDVLTSLTPLCAKVADVLRIDRNSFGCDISQLDTPTNLKTKWQDSLVNVNEQADALTGVTATTAQALKDSVNSMTNTMTSETGTIGEYEKNVSDSLDKGSAETEDSATLQGFFNTKYKIASEAVQQVAQESKGRSKHLFRKIKKDWGKERNRVMKRKFATLSLKGRWDSYKKKLTNIKTKLDELKGIGLSITNKFITKNTYATQGGAEGAGATFTGPTAKSMAAAAKNLKRLQGIAERVWESQRNSASKGMDEILMQSLQVDDSLQKNLKTENTTAKRTLDQENKKLTDINEEGARLLGEATELNTTVFQNEANGNNEFRTARNELFTKLDSLNGLVEQGLVKTGSRMASEVMRARASVISAGEKAKHQLKQTVGMKMQALDEKRREATVNVSRAEERYNDTSEELVEETNSLNEDLTKANASKLQPLLNAIQHQYEFKLGKANRLGEVDAHTQKMDNDLQDLFNELKLVVDNAFTDADTKLPDLQTLLGELKDAMIKDFKDDTDEIDQKVEEKRKEVGEARRSWGTNFQLKRTALDSALKVLQQRVNNENTVNLPGMREHFEKDSQDRLDRIHEVVNGPNGLVKLRIEPLLAGVNTSIASREQTVRTDEQKASRRVLAAVQRDDGVVASARTEAESEMTRIAGQVKQDTDALAEGNRGLTEDGQAFDADWQRAVGSDAVAGLERLSGDVTRLASESKRSQKDLAQRLLAMKDTLLERVQKKLLVPMNEFRKNRKEKLAGLAKDLRSLEDKGKRQAEEESERLRDGRRKAERSVQSFASSLDTAMQDFDAEDLASTAAASEIYSKVQATMKAQKELQAESAAQLQASREHLAKSAARGKALVEQALAAAGAEMTDTLDGAGQGVTTALATFDKENDFRTQQAGDTAAGEEQNVKDEVKEASDAANDATTGAANYLKQSEERTGGAAAHFSTISQGVKDTSGAMQQARISVAGEANHEVGEAAGRAAAVMRALRRIEDAIMEYKDSLDQTWAGQQAATKDRIAGMQRGNTDAAAEVAAKAEYLGKTSRAAFDDLQASTKSLRDSFEDIKADVKMQLERVDGGLKALHDDSVASAGSVQRRVEHGVSIVADGLHAPVAGLRAVLREAESAAADREESKADFLRHLHEVSSAEQHHEQEEVEAVEDLVQELDWNHTRLMRKNAGFRAKDKRWKETVQKKMKKLGKEVETDITAALYGVKEGQEKVVEETEKESSEVDQALTKHKEESQKKIHALYAMQDEMIAKIQADESMSSDQKAEIIRQIEEGTRKMRSEHLANAAEEEKRLQEVKIALHKYGEMVDKSEAARMKAVASGQLSERAMDVHRDIENFGKKLEDFQGTGWLSSYSALPEPANFAAPAATSFAEAASQESLDRANAQLRTSNAELRTEIAHLDAALQA